MTAHQGRIWPQVLLAPLGGAAALIMMSACSSDGQEKEEVTSSDETTATSANVSGARITSVSLSDTHTVEFWTLTNGAVLAHETMLVDSTEKPVLRFAEGQAPSLGDIYRSAVGASAEIPPALLEADALAASAVDPVIGAPDEMRTVVADRSARVATSAGDRAASQSIGTVSQAAVASCSQDLIGDNWGAQWFLNNFCTQGNFRACFTDFQSFSTSGLGGDCRTGSSFYFTEMNADFSNHELSMRGSHWNSSKGRLELDFDFPVQPRFVSSIAFKFKGDMCLGGDRFQNCRTHSHAALGWNK